MVPLHLIPFPGEAVPAGCVVAGMVWREGARLVAAYRVTAPAGALVVPCAAGAPARCDDLWRSTCFELFAGARGRPGYLEVNYSPAGDWNVYRFSGYREGMEPLGAPRLAPYTVVETGGAGAIELGFSLALPDDLGQAPSLEVAASAVLEHAGGARSHWALVHRGDRPDFHRRDAFVLAL